MSDDAEYDLVMPFVAVSSQGGPYADDAFVAGYQCGQIDKQLAAAAAVGANHIVAIAYSNLSDQLDLIAMRYGYTVDAVVAGEWGTFSFLMDVAEIDDE